MDFEGLLEPVSETSVCGPDLDLADDDAYLTYMFAAEERLPQRFFSGDQKPFDHKQIDLENELSQISELVKRSRDLRMLTLAARFLVTCGDVSRYCKMLENCAELLKERWEEVHPSIEDDLTLRQNTLETLNSLPTGSLPLQFAELIKDKQLGSVTLRGYKIACGELSNPDDGTDPKSPSAYLDALGKDEHKDAISSLFQAVMLGQQALQDLKTVFAENSSYQGSLSFTEIIETMSELREMLVKARPELSANSETEADSNSGDDAIEASDPDVGNSRETESNASSASPSPSTVCKILDHAHAKLALAAAENYFSNYEPTSPALLLINQSRILVGKPLMEALEMLMPAEADRAVIKLGGGSGLQIDANRLRSLGSKVQETCGETGLESQLDGFEAVEDRSSAVALLNDVESFFVSREPSSPVPMLLKRAKDYINADFASIIQDLIPKQEIQE